MDASQIIQGWDLSFSREKKKALQIELAFRINELLLNDFEELVQLLYRIDVPEKELKKVLEENKETDAGELIAELLIKRQEEKIAIRQSLPPAKNISEDECW